MAVPIVEQSGGGSNGFYPELVMPQGGDTCVQHAPPMPGAISTKQVEDIPFEVNPFEDGTAQVFQRLSNIGVDSPRTVTLNYRSISHVYGTLRDTLGLGLQAEVTITSSDSAHFAITVDFGNNNMIEGYYDSQGNYEITNVHGLFKTGKPREAAQDIFAAYAYELSGPPVR